jgi:hypothetical protein
MAEHMALSFPATNLGFPSLGTSLVTQNQGLPGWFVGDVSTKQVLLEQPLWGIYNFITVGLTQLARRFKTP